MDSKPDQTSANVRPDAALLETVYRQLRRIAELRLRHERPDHTLQATALVHEAWLKISSDAPPAWSGPAHFYVAAAEAMRRILIDHARKRATEKRGGREKHLSPGDSPQPPRARRLPDIENVADLASDEKIDDALALDAMISRLEQDDAQAALVVRLRFFAGLSVDETAAALGVAPRSVDRDWAYARSWLQREWRNVAE